MKPTIRQLPVIVLVQVVGVGDGLIVQVQEKKSKRNAIAQNLILSQLVGGMIRNLIIRIYRHTHRFW